MTAADSEQPHELRTDDRRTVQRPRLGQMAAVQPRDTRGQQRFVQTSQLR